MLVKCVRVSKKCSKEARQRANCILADVRAKLTSQYKFTTRLVGSATRNTIVEDSRGAYDLDYQIILTLNSKNNIADANEVKQKFLQAFVDCKNDNEKVENSTSVITLRVSKSEGQFDSTIERYSIDFGILKVLNDDRLMIKRNEPNHYTWVQLGSKNSGAYERFNQLSSNEKQDLCDNYIIPRKCKEKQKPNKDDRISSTVIFIEETNNYWSRKRK